MSTVEMQQASDAESDRRFDEQSPAERDARVAPERLGLRPGLPPKYYATVHGVETLAALKELAKMLECVGYPIALESAVANAFAAIAKAEGRQQ